MSPVNDRLRPSFLIVGAQKAGTTALFSYLATHPAIVAPSKKEIDFFWVGSNYARGTSWYGRHFDRGEAGPDGPLTFEATPHYLTCSQSPGRIYRYNPAMKLIVLLREPISRAYSHYQHYRRKLGNAQALLQSAMRYDEPVKSFFLGLRDPVKYGTFAEEVEREMAVLRGDSREFVPGIVRGGFYSLHLERFVEKFPWEQILVINSQRLRDSRLDVLTQVTRFLDLPLRDWRMETLPDENRGGYSTSVDPKTCGMLGELYAPHNQRLFDLIGERFPGWSRPARTA